MHRYEDFLAQGITPAEVRRRVSAGELIRLRRGAFADPGSLATPEDKHVELIAATVPAISSDSVLSHTSAAVLHGLPVPASTLARVHITRPGKGHGGRVGRHTHRHTTRLSADARAELRGWPVTTYARTVVDCARSLPYADAVAVVDAALRQGLDRAALFEELDRARRQPGNVAARQAVTFGDGRAESPGESRSRVVIAQLGLPTPDLQREFFNDRGQVDARVDFDWPDFGVCGEFDGETKYGRLRPAGLSLEQVMIFEKQREERLREHGRWTVRWVSATVNQPEALRRVIENGFRHGPRNGQWR